MNNNYLIKLCTLLCVCLFTGAFFSTLAQTQVTSRVSASSDDAEQRGSNATSSPGGMYLNSSDLELVRDGSSRGNQLIGMRFRGLNIPQGATITSAYVQFTTDETNSGTTNLTIRGEDSNNASAFTSSNGNISSRALTSASVAWNNVPAWNRVGQASSNQRTPDLKTIIQEIVNRNAWQSGNAMVIIISGTGERTAESYDGSASNAPLLVVNYSTGSTGNNCSATVQNFPYVESFEGGLGGWTNAATGDDIDWTRDSGGTPSSNTGPSSASAGSVYVYVEASNPNFPSRTAALISPCFDLTGLTTPTLTFDYHMYGSQINNLKTEVSTDGGSSWTQIFSRSNNQGNSWFAQSIDLNTYKSSNVVFRFTATTGASSSNGWQSDIAIDNIRVDNGNTNPGGSCDEIACFTSIRPIRQTSRLTIPSSHSFQMLMKQGENYTTGGGRVPGNHDFTGYVPISNSSTNGYLSVNHENTPGGVSMMRVNYNATARLWNVSRNEAVDFYNNDLVTTTRNCSGGVTPWGTVITCEETYNGGDGNRDGYTDVGWCVEINPANARVRSYGNGRQEKLWALGRMRHENVVVANDRRTVYFGEDGGTSCVYKFVANAAEDLSSGTLYVLRLDGGLSSGNPSRSTGSWVRVPNSTQSDRNNTSSIASSLGANNFNGVEDVEIHPITGQIYYTSKGYGRVYRFTDNGSTVSGFQVYVGGRSYPITSNNGTNNVSWGSGNDNLAFDNDGNLWVLQDGGNDYIWVVENEHTQNNPKVKIFASTPNGSEPTGITFSPDNRFMFLSIQHPSSSNASQTDAAGNSVRFNRSATIVIARNENLGTSSARAITSSILENTQKEKGLKVFPNPSQNGKVKLSFTMEYESEVIVDLLNIQGQKIATMLRSIKQAGDHELALDLNQYVHNNQNLLMAITYQGSVT